MIRLLLALSLALVTACCATVPEPFDPKSTTDRLQFNDNGVCSGTATGPNEITTASHCLSSRLLSVNGERTNMLHSRKVGRDITLIYVDRRNTAVAQWRDTAPVQGERIRYWGNPLGMRDQYREGYVSGQQGDAYLVDVEIAPGDSGAAVYDLQGRIIGVVSAYGVSGPFRMAVVVRRRE